MFEKFYRGKGCDKCNRTGYKGRLGIYELMLMNDEMRDMIIRNCSTEELRNIAKKNGMVTLRDAGDPVEVARRYDEQGADELVFLDISASHEGRAIMLEMVRRVAEQIFMPFTVGGGIRTLDDATQLIQAGAEKVSLNTALADSQLATLAAKTGSVILPIAIRRDASGQASLQANNPTAILFRRSAALGDVGLVESIQEFGAPIGIVA